MTKCKRNRKKKRSRGSVPDCSLVSQQEKIDALIEEAEAAVDSFNYDEAESKLKEVLQTDPNHVKSSEMLSSVYIEKFQWQEAQNLLKHCIQLSPETGYSKYFSMGQLCEGLESVKYYEKGIQILEKELQNGENTEPSKESSKDLLQKNLSDAYCSVAEIFMTDCCFEENAEDKCRSFIELAIKSHPSNPEAYQCLANFQLVKEQTEEAKEAIQKSLSLWLPQYEALRDEEAEENPAKASENVVPVYDSRIKTSKLLIELEMFYEASKILEGLLEEDDEVIEVWYLLGWLNYMRGDEYKRNSHFYLKKAKQVSIKLRVDDDECVDHINELLNELSQTHPLSDDEVVEENSEPENEGDDSESDFSTDSEDEQMET